jgi:hypothetical protein
MHQKERKAERPNAHHGPTVALDRQGLAPSKSGREREGERARREIIELNRIENYINI